MTSMREAVHKGNVAFGPEYLTNTRMSASTGCGHAIALGYGREVFSTASPVWAALAATASLGTCTMLDALAAASLRL